MRNRLLDRHAGRSERTWSGGERLITPTILSDGAIRADLIAWNPAWGDRAAWSDEIAWSLAAAIDPLVANPEFRARYALTRGRPATDPAQLLRAVGFEQFP